MINKKSGLRIMTASGKRHELTFDEVNEIAHRIKPKTGLFLMVCSYAQKVFEHDNPFDAIAFVTTKCLEKHPEYSPDWVPQAKYDPLDLHDLIVCLLVRVRAFMVLYEEAEWFRELIFGVQIRPEYNDRIAEFFITAKLHFDEEEQHLILDENEAKDALHPIFMILKDTKMH